MVSEQPRQFAVGLGDDLAQQVVAGRQAGGVSFVQWWFVFEFAI